VFLFPFLSVLFLPAWRINVLIILVDTVQVSDSSSSPAM